jgi:DNA-binding transcriptional MocR family regulator
MSSVAMKWAKRQRFGDGLLSALVTRLAQYADSSGAAYPSQATLAADCGVSERSVRRALMTLQQFGVITRRCRSKGRMGRTTDLVVLALHRDFDIGRATIVMARRPKFQPDNLSVPTGQFVRGITKRKTTSPYQEEGISKVEGCSATRGGILSDRANCNLINVVPFQRRGAA